MSKRKRKRNVQPGNKGGAGSKKSDQPESNPSAASAISANSENKSTTTPARKTTSISQYVSFGLLLGVIALVSFLFYEVMAKFVVPLFLAALLVVVFRPVHNWILEKTSGREKLSALLTTGVVLLAVLIPLGGLLVMAAAEGRHVIQRFNPTQVSQSLREARANLGLEMPSPNAFRTIESELLDLEQDVEPSDSVADRHQTSLYLIKESARSIAKSHELPWPEDAETFNPETNENASLWQTFVYQLTRARIMHDNMEMWSSPPQQENLEAHRQYRIQISKLADAFAKFQTDFLGGKFKATLIHYANPSEEESSTYISEGIVFLKDRVLKLGGAGAAYAGSLVLGTAIMIIGLYFFLLDGPGMIEAFKGLSPIDDEHEQELVSEFSKISRAVVLATLLSALAQGLLAGIGFYFVGLDSVFLLTVLSAVLAMVPFVGAAAVWVPCALYLYFVENNLAGAIGLGLYGALVISMADNIIKPLVLHGQSNIHPLLALLSVLGGVTTLGPIGILVGPMVVAFLQTLLKILQREMMDMDQESSGDPPTPTTS